MHTVTQLNIANTIHSIYHESPILGDMIDKEEIGIVGALYDINSGDVAFQDFSPLINQLDTPGASQLNEKLSKTIKAAKRMLPQAT